MEGPFEKAYVSPIILEGVQLRGLRLGLVKLPRNRR